jgi:hypothetical protein
MNRSPQAARRVIVKSSLNGKVPPILRHAGRLFQVPSFRFQVPGFKSERAGFNRQTDPLPKTVTDSAIAAHLLYNGCLPYMELRSL